MITFVSLLKNTARNIVLVAIMVFNLLSASLVDAQQFMSLGSLRFVLPDENATMDSRTIRMKMARGSNSSLNFNLVGGVAFTQQAIPDFKVRKLDMFYSSEDNKAHLKINKIDITIPLEMFELQPIVNFADSEDEVVVTLYGNSYGTVNSQESQKILFHPAFIDNIMGLRLLQVDAMAMLGEQNGEFPIFRNNSYCLTNSEREKYELLNKQLESRGSSYSKNAKEAYNQIDSIISGFDSYIYTDIDEPIHFSIVNDSILFNGMPYYQFNNWCENEINPLFCYYSMMEIYKDSLVQYCIESLSEQTLSILIWKQLYPNRSFNKMSFTGFDYSKWDIDKSKWISENKAHYDSIQFVTQEYYDNVFKTFVELDNQHNMTDEQKADKLIHRIQDEYKTSDPELAQSIKILLATHFPLSSVNVEITNNLRERPELVRQLNPIVYQEVDDICQWAALFRYIKANNAHAWKRFVTQVNMIKPNAPSVKTPIYQKR